jgi:predicted enzyme related to lactoylglutathione lyase
MNGICHIEIPSKDFEKAKKFYGDVFGWECQPMLQMEYMTFKAPSGIGGGFEKRAEIAANPGISLYIEVEDIPATIDKVKKIGGKEVVPKKQISPEYGYFAFVSDLEGNRIGLWAQK